MVPEDSSLPLWAAEDHYAGKECGGDLAVPSVAIQDETAHGQG